MLKAYHAQEKDSDYATIVFAENATQAKSIAQGCDCCETAQYIDLRVHRVKEADKLYKGHAEIDWYDEDTRLTLVRDLSWACLEPSWECDSCRAKAYCRWHEQEEENAAD